MKESESLYSKRDLPGIKALLEALGGIKMGIVRVSEKIAAPPIKYPKAPKVAAKICAGKLVYDSMDAAQAAAVFFQREYKGYEEKFPYRCPECKKFHLTSQV